MQFSRFSIARAAVVAAAVVFSSGAAVAATVSPNLGSLGAAANGLNSDAVTFGPGAVTAGPDLAPVYNNTDAARTTVPYQAALNPAASSPFTIEFWANPVSNAGNDSAPVANRVSANPRSGWAFFQRDEATGWNFRAYSGSGTSTSIDITGGTAPLNTWSHVALSWTGSAANLYVNGELKATAAGTYAPNSTIPLTIGALADATGSSPIEGSVDEVAFYGTALSEAQLLNHVNLRTSGTPGAYSAAVLGDSPLLYLANVPEPTSALGLGLAGLLAVARRRRTA